jgi:solute carrier family 30 (zinc transporter), member 1
VKRTGHILLQSPPTNIDVDDIKHDLEKVSPSLSCQLLCSRRQIPGVVSIHELHVWRLNQQKSLATTHIVVDNDSLANFQGQAKTILECLHAYGVHSVTIQPELSPLVKTLSGGQARVADASCQMNCGTVCETMTCCG